MIHYLPYLWFSLNVCFKWSRESRWVGWMDGWTDRIRDRMYGQTCTYMYNLKHQIHSGTRFFTIISIIQKACIPVLSYTVHFGRFPLIQKYFFKSITWKQYSDRTCKPDIIGRVSETWTSFNKTGICLHDYIFYGRRKRSSQIFFPLICIKSAQYVLTWAVCRNVTFFCWNYLR